MNRVLATCSVLVSLLACAQPSAEVSPREPASVDQDPEQRAARLAELGIWAKANMGDERFLLLYNADELQAGAEQGALVTIVAFVD